VDERYERLRAHLLEAIAEHERGELDDETFRGYVRDMFGAVDRSQKREREALFEADVTLELIMDGVLVDPEQNARRLKRMRRNLREVMQ
jgi:hypothetical protein